MKKLLIGIFIILVLVGLVIGFRVFFNETDGQRVHETAPKDSNITNEKAERQTNGKKDYSAIGFDLLSNESLGFLKFGLADADVVGLLGEADEKSKALVWGADGEEHQTWYYHFKGIELDMIKKGDGLIINTITMTSPCEFKTLRNIGIGSFKGQVMDAYEYEIDPEKLNRGRSTLIAGTEFGGIVFHFQNNRVSSIFIGAAAE